MTEQTAIIIGASHAGAQLATSLRQEGWLGAIIMIGDEPQLPYHRPPLSKTFLAGEKTAEELLIRPASFYEKNNIQYQYGKVIAIHRTVQTIEMHDGNALHYDKLALCVGAHVRKLNLQGSDLDGVHYLRTIDDVENIKKSINRIENKSKNAVIIGGGYIGLETAAALRKQGVNVTVLEMAERVLQRVTAPEMSEFYTRLHTENGVNIHTGITLARIDGTTHVTGVACADGVTFPADIVIVGIGVLPNIALAESAGITLDNGIIVDEYCRTNDPNIVAAGDCTNHFNATYRRHVRLESVPNANEQAKTAAATLCGHDKPYQSLPWFWSDQYNVKLQIAGLNTGYDRVVIRSDRHTGQSFAAFYFCGNELIAADCVNRPQEFLLSKKILTEKLRVDPLRLADETIAVKELLAT